MDLVDLTSTSDTEDDGFEEDPILEQILSEMDLLSQDPGNVVIGQGASTSIPDREENENDPGSSNSKSSVSSSSPVLEVPLNQSHLPRGIVSYSPLSSSSEQSGETTVLVRSIGTNQNRDQTIAPSSSNGPNISPTQRGKRKSLKDVLSSSEPQEKKNRTRSNGPVNKRLSGTSRERRDSGISDEQGLPYSESVSENSWSPDPEDVDEEELQGETVQQFSIHRLLVEKLKRDFKEGSIIPSELDIIKKIMAIVNKKYDKSDTEKFEPHIPTDQIPEESSEPSSDDNERTESFRIIAYAQKVTFADAFLKHLSISGDITKINKIVFYYKTDEIFAITLAQTWQMIQPFCCHDFPYIISGRLTSPDGNYKETKKHITGNVRTSSSTKKNPTLLDQIKNIRLSVTKELRPDCSLYWLKEFLENREKGITVKLTFGLASIRILKRMHLKNLPEILNHFADICRGEKTFTYKSKKEEKQFDDFPPLRILPTVEERQKVEKRLHEIIHKFLHNSNKDIIREFDFCDKYVEDFTNAECFKLIYATGTITKLVAKFPTCPTALQVFEAVRMNCAELTKDTKFSTFSNKLRGNLNVEYCIRGSAKKEHRKAINLIEGELQLNDQDYWKIMGYWCRVRQEYYYDVHKEFLDLLNKPRLLCLPSDHVNLPHKWNFETMSKLQDYVESYRDKHGYFLPLSEEQLASMSSQPMEFEVLGDDEDNLNASRVSVSALQRRQLGSGFLYDLLYLRKLENGFCSFTLFYIFDRFDAGIRDASTKITKSLDLLVKENKTKSTTILNKIYDLHSHEDAFFNSLFCSCDDFKSQLTEGPNVSVVVAFLTQSRPRPELDPNPGSIRHYFPSRQSGSPEQQTYRSLEHEKNLLINFNEDIIRETVLDKLSPIILEKMCDELGVPAPSARENYDVLLVAKELLQRLSSEGYCFETDSPEKPVSGKLLKLRSAKNFKPFRSTEINEKIFNQLKENFISHFPGFIHKLECFEIYKSLSELPRLAQMFTEIPVELSAACS